MTPEALLLFAGAVFILGITPGPGVLLVVARTLSGGLSHAAMTILGIVTADIIFLLLVVYGLQAIAESLGFVFIAIKYLGGAYLIWLGISIWRNRDQKLEVPIEKKRSTFINNWTSGLIITLSNPKAILFYMSFLPAFVDIPKLTNMDIIIIAIILCSVLGSVMLFYAFTTLKTQKLFKQNNSSQITQRITGSLMVTTGSLMILKS
jgi:threonine/homoserine/homoserine lactone efflux protein